MEGLRSCDHQVGGHMTKDNKPDTLIDAAGNFYKPYQADARNERECAFYMRVYGLESDCSGNDCPGGSASAASVSEHPPLDEDVQALKPFIAGFYGVKQINGRRYMVMQDVCRDYRQPCVLDAKMGFTTLYDWAEEKYKAKVIEKDRTTTQGTCGFRISGLQVYQQGKGSMQKMERPWGKTLTKDTIHTAFTMFADNGALSAQELFLGPHGFLPQLQRLQQWFETQRSFQFFQASVLFTYEGEAKSIEEAKPQVHLIDFAHTFSSKGQMDNNFLAGLKSLITVLESLV